MPLRTITADLIEANNASGVWQRGSLYDVVDETALDRGDDLAVADQHERLTYREFVRRSHALAAWLLDQGLRPGAPVALQTANSVAVAITHMACDRADLTFIPLSTAWRGHELAHLLKLSKAEIVIVPPPIDDVDFLDLVTDLRGDLPDLRLVGTRGYEAPAADFNFDDVSTQDSREVRTLRDPNIGRFVMVTSGTTDLPKMSLWTDNNLWFFMQCYIEAVGLRKTDIAVGIAPANTGATGYVFPVLAPLLAGATSILLEHWSPREALDLLVAEKATVATAIPTQVIMMLQDPSLGDHDFSSLRVFQNAGSAMPPEAARQMEKVFGCIGHVVYGATDGGTPMMTTVRDAEDKRWTTVGRTAPHHEVRLVDPNLQDVPAGQPGEIMWRGPTKDLGYLNEPEMTAAAFVDDGWYRSGDLGEFDADGYLRIVGRAKDLIIRGGQNISPVEVESLLFEHPKIAEVSVIGVPDPVYGERACACVVPADGAALELSDVTEFLSLLGVVKFKFPERLELFTELPKSPGGKITKVELRARVAARSA